MTITTFTKPEVKFRKENQYANDYQMFFVDIANIKLGYRQCYSKNPEIEPELTMDEKFALRKQFDEWAERTIQTEEKLFGTTKHFTASALFNAMAEKLGDHDIWIYLARCAWIKKFLNKGHESPFEHGVMTYKIDNMSRSASHQFVRCRLSSYCVAGYTKISTSSGKTDKMTIAELFAMPPEYRKLVKVRYADQFGELKHIEPEAILYTGQKPVYRVTTVHGYTVDTTADHRFLTDTGWKKLKDLIVGQDYVRINGQPAYQNYEWLRQKYQVENLSQEEIGDLCGVTHHCIRAWVRKFNLQKPAGSRSIGVEPPNKGKTKENHESLRRTSEKLKGNENLSARRFGEDNPAFKGWHAHLSDTGYRARFARNYIKTGICQLCGAQGKTELHHIDGDVSNYSSYDNGLEVCIPCHKILHRRGCASATIRSLITNIEYVGVTDVYDIMMPNKEHNFIGNGFVLHNCQNSQRYIAEDTENLQFILPEPIQNNPDAKKVVDEFLTSIPGAITKLKELGIKNEDIRAIYPNATPTSLVVTMNYRELKHLIELRTSKGAQAEIKYIVRCIWMYLTYHMPFIWDGVCNTED